MKKVGVLCQFVVDIAMKTKGKVKSHQQAQGYISQNKGLRFESKVLSHFSQKGWKPELHKHIPGVGEIDIYGKKSDSFGNISYLLVECKDRASGVTSDAFIRFMNKVRDFKERMPRDVFGNKPPITAYIAHTGKVVKGVKEAALHSGIKFEKFE